VGTMWYEPMVVASVMADQIIHDSVVDGALEDEQGFDRIKRSEIYGDGRA
jgi:hypothetical protein